MKLRRSFPKRGPSAPASLGRPFSRQRKRCPGDQPQSCATWGSLRNGSRLLATAQLRTPPPRASSGMTTVARILYSRHHVPPPATKPTACGVVKR
jgi:hypothetical protein